MQWWALAKKQQHGQPTCWRWGLLSFASAGSKYPAGYCIMRDLRTLDLSRCHLAHSWQTVWQNKTYSTYSSPLWQLFKPCKLPITPTQIGLVRSLSFCTFTSNATFPFSTTASPGIHHLHSTDPQYWCLLYARNSARYFTILWMQVGAGEV